MSWFHSFVWLSNIPLHLLYLFLCHPLWSFNTTDIPSICWGPIDLWETTNHCDIQDPSTLLQNRFLLPPRSDFHPLRDSITPLRMHGTWHVHLLRFPYHLRFALTWGEVLSRWNPHGGMGGNHENQSELPFVEHMPQDMWSLILMATLQEKLFLGLENSGSERLNDLRPGDCWLSENFRLCSSGMRSEPPYHTASSFMKGEGVEGNRH